MPFATTTGRGVVLLVVLERDRVVRRVDDHDVGLRDRDRHPALRELFHLLAALALDVRVAFLLLVLAA